MAWARFDDQYHRNPKVLSVAATARWLHAASVTHCRLGRSLTGFMTTLEAEGLAVEQSVSRRAIQELAVAGLWDRVDGGFVVHDYPDYLPESSKERTQAWRDRQSQGGHGDAAVTVTKSHKAVSRATGIPNPNPNPVHASPNGSASPVDLVPLPPQDHEETGSGTRIGEIVLISAAQFVGEYADLREEVGSPSIASDRARIGKDAKQLLAAGKAPEVISAALKRLVDRARPPSALVGLVDEVERERAGRGSRASHERPVDRLLRQVEASRAAT